MNRQLRRAQEKADDKKAKEKQRAKQSRQTKTQTRRAKRSEPKKAAAPVKRRPDLFYRFAGPITIFTTAFIALQALRPVENTIELVVQVAYYFIFGYGLSLWLFKRGQANAQYIAAGVGVAVAVGAQFLPLAFPALLLVPNLQLMLLAAGLSIVGALLGQWVHSRIQT
ncbi:hypothetical protein BH24DEI2_BH24DEI2_15710 [soil metagenome]